MSRFVDSKCERDTDATQISMNVRSIYPRELEQLSGFCPRHHQSEQCNRLTSAKSYPAFQSYLRKRLISSDGRFFMLHLRSAERFGFKKGIALAPQGSLAYHVEIKGKEMRHIGPNVKLLADEFFDHR